MKPPVSFFRIGAVRAVLCAVLLMLFAFPAWAESGDGGEPYSQQELAQMLAPIALYPDALLSQILIAATYPIEVIEADRWLQRQGEMDDDDLDDALYDKAWDPSVKALCHFPTLLSRLSEQISETTNLGNAFLAQEDEVMAMVQQLRAKAYQEGNLYTNRQQKVIVEREIIVIEPARPQVIYVPYYDPYYVYGSWWYPDYPPYYWGPVNVRLGFGITFSSGISLSFVFTNWSYVDWSHRLIYFNTHNRPRFVRKEAVVSTKVWQHVPTHRRGVAYRDTRTARKYGQAPQYSEQSRRVSRGYDEPTTRQVTPTRTEPSRQSNEKQRNVSSQRSEPVKTVTPTTSERDVRETSRQTSQTRATHATQQRETTRETASRQPVATPSTSRESVSPAVQKASQPVSTTREHKSEQTRQSPSQSRERDSVFTQVDSGQSERQSSQRGKASRQQQPQQQKQRDERKERK